MSTKPVTNQNPNECIGPMYNSDTSQWEEGDWIRSCMEDPNCNVTGGKDQEGEEVDFNFWIFKDGKWMLDFGDTSIRSDGRSIHTFTPTQFRCYTEALCSILNEETPDNKVGAIMFRYLGYDTPFTNRAFEDPCIHGALLSFAKDSNHPLHGNARYLLGRHDNRQPSSPVEMGKELLEPGEFSLVSPERPDGFSIPPEDPPLVNGAIFSSGEESIQPTVDGMTTTPSETVLAEISGSGIFTQEYLPLRRYNRIGPRFVDHPASQSFHFAPSPETTETKIMTVQVGFQPGEVSYEKVEMSVVGEKEKTVYYKIPILMPENGYADLASFKVAKDTEGKETWIPLNTLYPDLRLVTEKGNAFILVAVDLPGKIIGFQYSITKTTASQNESKTVQEENRTLPFAVDYSANPDLKTFVEKVKKTKASPSVKTELLRRWVESNIRYANTQSVAELYQNFYTEPEKGDVVNFALKNRVGTCGIHEVVFASLVREVLGLPTRRVEGYLINGTTVRPNDFHAWTEVFLENRGWVRFDATPRG